MDKLTQEKIADIEGKVADLQDAMDSFRKSGLPEKTLLVLLNHYTGVPQRTIKLVISGFDNLYEVYFKDEDQP